MPRRWKLLAAAVTVVGLSTGGAATVASAAPPYATDATLTNMQFVESTIESGSAAQLRGDWSLPDYPATPAGFVVDLPEGLQGLRDAFPLVDPDGVTLGTCIVSETQITCDIDDAYVDEHPIGLNGSFQFWATVTTEVTDEQQVTYTFDDVEATVTVTPAPAPCPDCTFEGQGPYKWGQYDRADDRVRWVVSIPAPREGTTAGQTVTVVERLGPNQEWLMVDGAPVIYVTGANTLGADGYPTGWDRVDDRVDSQVEFIEGGAAVRITFVTEEGWYYAIEGRAQVTDGGASGTYTNSAEITVEGQDAVPVEAEVVRQGGSGDGSGSQVGRFAITKDVDWAGPALPGQTFTGSYTATTPDGVESSGTFEVVDGETWTSPNLPAGSTVTLTEDAPSGPANIDWATPAFSDDSITIAGASTVAVTLTNTPTVAEGRFAASKRFEGDGAGLVADDAVFVLDYAYPAGTGFEAGSGSLELPADGTVVESPALPVGAVVTLVERAPSNVAGAAWGERTLSTDTVTIGRDAVVEVIVTNTIAATPPPPAQLPQTGAEPGLIGLAIGGLLVAAGLVVARRRKALHGLD